VGYEDVQARVTSASGLRGSPISGERYYDPAFARLEWDHMWTRVWHVAGLSSELAEPGDHIVHKVGRESVLVVRQDDGGVRAFYNVCRHRANKLVWHEFGSSDHFTCAYHGWRWGLDGSLQDLQDPEDFDQNLCRTLRLKELACEERLGFVWFNMSHDSLPLGDYLAQIEPLIAPYALDEMVRVTFHTVEVDCNWKVIRDNFNESYHLPSIHPQLATYFDEDYRNTEFHQFDHGNNLMVMKGALPSPRGPVKDRIQEPLLGLLRTWELEPDSFAGRWTETRTALQAQMRKLGPSRGRPHYAQLSDAQLTDAHHFTLFPNLNLTFHPDRFTFLRTEPHPTDPEKCIFSHWFFVRPEPGESPPAEAEHVSFRHGEQPIGPVFDQDLGVVLAQQEGVHSRGFDRFHLGGQEFRIQRFHEILDDYIAGRV